MSQSGLSGGNGFDLVDVEAGAGEPPLLQGCDQRGFVNDLAAGDIHDQGRWLHGGDLGRADQVKARLVTCRADHDRVGLSQRLAHALAR